MSSRIDRIRPVSGALFLGIALHLSSAASVSAAVFDIRAAGTDLFAAGDFDTLDGVAARCIARWDGTRWNALGLGVAGGDVRALGFHQGNLVVAGSFTAAGGAPAAGIALWNGVTWTALGGGVAGTVRAVATFGPDLVVGGSFSATGDGPARNIARWDGAMWHTLGDGVRLSPGAFAASEVTALAVHEGMLFATGTFDSAGTVAANHVARWDGASWSPLGDGLCSPPFPLAVGSDLAVFEAAVVASGCFSCAGSIVAHHAAAWNGSLWSDMGFAFEAYCPEFEIEVLNGSLFAAGLLLHPAFPNGTSIVRWNGTAWDAHAPAPEPLRRIEALASYAGWLVAGGWFQEAGGGAVPGIAAWDGQQWQALSSTPTSVPTQAQPPVHELIAATSCGTRPGIRLRLRIAIPGAEARLRLVDARGRIRGRLDDGWLEPGEHTLLWNEHPPRGVYWVVLDAGSSRDARRLVWTSGIERSP